MSFSPYGLDLFGDPLVYKKSGPLSERFEFPPFSVLNAREGDWQARKRAWIALGIQSEIGRGTTIVPNGTNRDASQDGCYQPGFHTSSSSNAMALAGGYGESHASGSSVFDPVLCELAYRWFCPPDGIVLDPFAGGSVRGIVAGLLGRRYHGIDLRSEQIAANREQLAEIASGSPVHWECGDARALVPAAPQSDFVFSCPPYGDLERYSDDPADLSTLEYAEFITAYRVIVAAAAARLKADRFAAFVVGDFRDKRTGHYRGFVGDTVAAFAAAGLPLYNDAVLVTSVGSLPVRVGKQFAASRKLGKTHQNVLVFVKGDAKGAAAVCKNGSAGWRST